MKCLSAAFSVMLSDVHRTVSQTSSGWKLLSGSNSQTDDCQVAFESVNDLVARV